MNSMEIYENLRKLKDNAECERDVKIMRSRCQSEFGSSAEIRVGWGSRVFGVNAKPMSRICAADV